MLSTLLDVWLAVSSTVGAWVIGSRIGGYAGALVARKWYG
jgi:hypothetical protein